MSKSKDGTKITLGMIKGKTINTSVPTIAIRFNANAEEIEELYQSEDEPIEKLSNDKNKPGISDPDTSPRRYLPRLGKRCTSVDASLVHQDLLPPSDRWKFFTEIKGKITKSVEEIKQRNQETETIGKKTNSTKEKDTSSLSESDDLSESSISKTCGIVSTTEGVEMSSDDDETSSRSIEIKKNPKRNFPNGKKHMRYRLVKRKKVLKDESAEVINIAELYEIATGSKPAQSNVSSESIEVESGVEALEDVNPQVQQDVALEVPKVDSVDINKLEETTKNVLKSVVDQIENIEVCSENKLKVLPISGSTVRQIYLNESSNQIYFEPEGFVDLRGIELNGSLLQRLYSLRYIALGLGLLFCHLFSIWPFYIYGFLSGVLATILYMAIYNTYSEYTSETRNIRESFVTHDSPEQAIFQIPAIKEYHPITKVEGWLNEYPEEYDPETYHIAKTQTVYVRLQGNLLRISHTRTKISKRALWNEPKHKHIIFCGHRIYGLQGARVILLPVGLHKRRQWSKKYPISITINKENLSLCDTEGSDAEDEYKIISKDESDVHDKQQKSAKKKKIIPTQIFSKLTEEEEKFVCDIDLDSSNKDDDGMEDGDEEDIYKEIHDGCDTEDALDWPSFVADQKCGPSEIQIYLFARTGREKEDWYRHFVKASHKVIECDDGQSTSQTTESHTSNNVENEEYLQYMRKFQKLYDDSLPNKDSKSSSNIAWANAIMSRILFDCTRDLEFKDKVQQRIQRKLNSFKLPYFIEQLTVHELFLGSSPPLIHRASTPTIDQRGLWIDLDVQYEGTFEIKLQTKLNLMKLKHLPSADNSHDIDSSFAKWQHSDVDDTAESSSDGENYTFPTLVKVSDGKLHTPAASSHHSSKKIFKMVDKIAESKLFQAATENRYIKKAMEGVSNTDLYLKVELKRLVGTLVVNMPPPPSDRIWFGFRPLPQLVISAQPIVGERNFSFIKQLTNWIEKKLFQEFQKVLVMPNMEDIMIPIMSSKLPT